METTIYSLLINIITPILITALLGLIAWIVKTILEITKVQSGLVKVVEIILENQKKSNESFAQLKTNVDRLIGQHELLSKYHEKKTS